MFLGGMGVVVANNRPYEHVRGPEHARVHFKSDCANLN